MRRCPQCRSLKIATQICEPVIGKEVVMAKDPKIELTTRDKLERLMSYEFFKEGDKSFDPSEPQKYVERLTKGQKHLLAISRPRELTAFIVFGDGSFDQKIGGGFVWDDEQETLDTKKDQLRCRDLPPTSTNDAVQNSLYLDIDIRPNASFALFYKHQNRKIELALYTRFFVINYSHKVPCAIIARKLIKFLDDNPQLKDTEQETIKQNVFKAMSKMWIVCCSCGGCRCPRPANVRKPNLEKKGSPPKYKYYLKNTGEGGGIPYIWLVDRQGKPLWWMRGRRGHWNTIHGTLPTKGCWMIFRNYKWNDEQSKNDAYFEFLRLFAGLHWSSEEPLHWTPNVFGNSCGPGKRWTSVYFFRRKHRFTPEPGDAKPFKLG
jgi:hypothetical protein